MGESPRVLLLDDGELDDVQRLIEQMGVQFARVRGGAILQDTPPPKTLLVATPRRMRAVREDDGSGQCAPVRVVVADQDSPALREQLRKIGFDYLVRRPVHPEALRLLLLHCVYTGEERRGQPRVPVGFEVFFRSGIRRRRAVLTDLSVGGCRLLTPHALAPGKTIKLMLPEELGATEPIALRGRVARSSFDEKLGAKGLHRSAVVFKEVPRETRQELEWIVEARARGPATLPHPGRDAEAADDAAKETPRGRTATRSDDARREPPVHVGTPRKRPRSTSPLSDRPPARPQDPRVEPPAVPATPDPPPTVAPPRPPEAEPVGKAPHATPAHAVTDGPGDWGDPFDRRRHRRGFYERKVPAFGDRALRVLVGRDLSARGMRVESDDLEIGDRIHVAIYGGSGDEPMLLWATAARNDRDGGIVLLFDEPEADIAHALEKLVAKLPAVEPLRDGEAKAMGTVIGEIVEP